jgi:trk system potassium uptake protein TrkA
LNIVIAGAGKVGYFLAQELMVDNEVTIIDSKDVAIQNIEETLDVLCIHGDVEDPYTYRNIQKDIDLFVAVTDTDEVNLLSCLIIDNIVNVKEKIVRLKNNFFINDNIKKKLGISTMITPALNVAENFNYLVDFPHVNNVKIFDYTKALLLSIRAHEKFEPVMISTFISKFDNKIIIAGIERGNKFSIPGEFDMILPNDLIYFLTFPGVVNEIRENICNKLDKQAIKNCIIYGANQLGIEISKVLAKKGLNIKLIDKNIENCQHANTILKNSVEVVKSNYDLDAVVENSTNDINVFIAATTDDEFNIIKCIEAKQKGIEKVIGIYNNKQYAILMRKLEIEVIRGEKMNAYYTILEKINATSNIIQKAFCGGDGTVCLRRIFPDSKLINTKPPISAKANDKGRFYIIRDKKFYLYIDIEKIEEEDIIVAFMQKKDTSLVANWLKLQSSE